MPAVELAEEKIEGIVAKNIGFVRQDTICNSRKRESFERTCAVAVIPGKARREP
jgi:hypothetical protein